MPMELFDESKLTKIVHEDNEVMILQLKQDTNGPLWRKTKSRSRRRSSRLVMPVPREGTRPEGGLVVAGATNQKEGRAIKPGDTVVG